MKKRSPPKPCESAEVTALLRRWSQHSHNIFHDTEGVKRRRITFETIARGSVAQRGAALTAIFAHPRITDHSRGEQCPRREVASLAEGLCESLDSASPQPLVSAVIFGVCLGKDVARGSSSHFSDPENLRDGVLLKLASLVTSSDDANRLEELLSRVECQFPALFVTPAMVNGVLFKIAPLLTTIEGAVRMALKFKAFPKWPESSKVVVSRRALLDCLTSLATFVLQRPPTLMNDEVNSASDAVACMFLSVLRDPATKRCPLLDDTEWYRTVFFPLLAMRHPRDRPVALGVLRTQLSNIRDRFLISEDFRDTVMLPNMSSTSSQTKLDMMSKLVSAVLDLGNKTLPHESRRVFITETVAKSLGVVMWQAHRKLSAFLDDDSIPDVGDVPHEVSLFASFAGLLGGFDRDRDGSSWRPRTGVSTPLWDSRVLFDDLLVPFVTVVRFDTRLRNPLFSLTCAFWARHPARVTAVELRDKIILPMATSRSRSRGIDVLPLMYELLKICQEDTLDNAAFKDAFTCGDAFKVYDNCRFQELDLEVTLPARCVLLSVVDGATLNGRRADYLTDICDWFLHAYNASSSSDCVAVVNQLAKKAPDETEAAAALRQLRLLDPQVLMMYLLTFDQASVRGSDSKSFFFRVLHRRV